METAKMRADTSYATCNGVRIEPVEPIHGRWAKVTDENDKVTFVELDDDALAGRKSDPWGRCHTRKAPLGVRVHQWARDDIDRDGNPRSGAEPTETVVNPRDIAGTWKDYMVLHGATVRGHADKVDADAQQERYEAAIARRITEMLNAESVMVDVVTHGEHRGHWRVSLRLTPERALMLASETLNA